VLQALTFAEEQNGMIVRYILSRLHLQVIITDNFSQLMHYCKQVSACCTQKAVNDYDFLTNFYQNTMLKRNTEPTKKRLLNYTVE
jgi:hypothetical protein